MSAEAIGLQRPKQPSVQAESAGWWSGIRKMLQGLGGQFAALSTLAVVIVIVVWAAVSPWMASLLLGTICLIALILVSVGIFPLTYFAYLQFRAPAQRDRLKDDFRLLGLESEAELENVVENLYQTVYSPGQFIVYITLIVAFTLIIGGAVLVQTQHELVEFLIPAESADTISVTHSITGTVTTPPAANIPLPKGNPVDIEQSPFYLAYFAFLGAYLFAVQELVRRYNTFDLLPQVYSSIFVRMLLATGIVFVATKMIGSGLEDLRVPMIVAFMIGTFPERGLKWLAERVSQTFDEAQRELSDSHPLTSIIGISPWHRSRLMEMGIDDAQNLATVDIRKLLLTTQFGTQQVVNWIDQAILYVKVHDKIDTLRENHVTTFYELRNALSNVLHPSVVAYDNSNPSFPEVEKFRALLTISDVSELEQILDTSNYPNFAHIVEYYARTSMVVQQRAEAGTEVIFGSRLPYLSMDIQGDGIEMEVDQATLEHYVALINKLLGNNQKNPKLWMALGVHQQGLAKCLGQGEQAKAKYQQANAAFDRALELAPDNAEAYLRRAALYLDIKEYKKAIYDCTRALVCTPANAVAYNLRGLAYVALDYEDLAQDDFDAALRLDERLAEAYMNWGTLRNARGEFGAAIHDFRAAHLCGFGRVATLLANWGKALVGTGQYSEAIEKLSEAIAKDPALAMPYADRGFAYLQQSAYRSAVNDLREAVRCDPTLLSDRCNLGLALAKSGDLQGAIKTYLEAIAFAPSAPITNITRLYLADAYEATGDIEAAMRTLHDVVNDTHATAAEKEQASVWLDRISLLAIGKQPSEPTPNPPVGDEKSVKTDLPDVTEETSPANGDLSAANNANPASADTTSPPLPPVEEQNNNL